MSTVVRRASQASHHRLLAAAAAIALSALLLMPSLAAAASSARYDLAGDVLTARVVGTSRTGVWRVRVVAPGGDRRIDIVLRSGDVAWNAVVRTSKRTTSGWLRVSRERLYGTQRGLERGSGESAGVRWNSRHFGLPRDGNAKFVVPVELTRDGRYRVVGAIRSAAEAFSYGPWQRVGSAVVDH